MNLKDYISSGILESYVLGDLSDHERKDVENNLSLYPELKSELEKIEIAQEKLLMTAGVTPPSAVKSMILERVQREHTIPERFISESKRTTSFWKLAAAASIAVAIVTSYLAYNYRNKWRSTYNELVAINAQNKQIAEDYNQVNKNLEKLSDDLKVLDDPQFKRVLLTGTANAPEAQASVYWNESTKEVYLRIQNMKDLAQENQYQLWAIIEGKPVDAGVFDAGADGLIKMKDVAVGATTFAVTVEPRGGRPEPALETMQVAGNVKKG